MEAHFARKELEEEEDAEEVPSDTEEEKEEIETESLEARVENEKKSVDDNDEDNNNTPDLSIEKTPNSEALKNVMKSLENVKMRFPKIPKHGIFFFSDSSERYLASFVSTIV